MLLWEALSAPAEPSAKSDDDRKSLPAKARRLPFDTRCSAITKSGRRCRGRIRNETEWCVFHDPEIAEKRRRNSTTASTRARRRLTHLPDGYLRKLNSRRSVGNAMDRLYREVRLGIVTAEMGQVLFSVLTRLLDSGLAEQGSVSVASTRSKVVRLRPKLCELLTRAERAAWRRAIAAAPPEILHAHRTPGELGPRPAETKRSSAVVAGSKRAAPLSLQVAS